MTEINPIGVKAQNLTQLPQSKLKMTEEQQSIFDKKMQVKANRLENRILREQIAELRDAEQAARKEQKQAERAERKETRQAERAAEKEMKEDIRTRRREAREEARETRKAEREEARQERVETREAYKQERSEIKSQKKAAREEIRILTELQYTPASFVSNGVVGKELNGKYYLGGTEVSAEEFAKAKPEN